MVFAIGTIWINLPLIAAVFLALAAFNKPGRVARLGLAVILLCVGIGVWMMQLAYWHLQQSLREERARTYVQRWTKMEDQLDAFFQSAAEDERDSTAGSAAGQPPRRAVVRYHDGKLTVSADLPADLETLRQFRVPLPSGLDVEIGPRRALPVAPNDAVPDVPPPDELAECFQPEFAAGLARYFDALAQAELPDEPELRKLHELVAELPAVDRYRLAEELARRRDDTSRARIIDSYDPASGAQRRYVLEAELAPERLHHLATLHPATRADDRGPGPFTQALLIIATIVVAALVLSAVTRRAVGTPGTHRS